MMRALVLIFLFAGICMLPQISFAGQAAVFHKEVVNQKDVSQKKASSQSKRVQSHEGRLSKAKATAIDPITTFFIVYYSYLFVSGIVRMISLSRIFDDFNIKSGKAFIPFYNDYVLCTEILHLPLWAVFAGYVDQSGLLFAMIVNIKLAEVYGKSVLFGLGLVFFPIIFYPILAYAS